MPDSDRVSAHRISTVRMRSAASAGWSVRECIDLTESMSARSRVSAALAWLALLAVAGPRASVYADLAERHRAQPAATASRPTTSAPATGTTLTGPTITENVRPDGLTTATRSSSNFRPGFKFNTAVGERSASRGAGCDLTATVAS